LSPEPARPVLLVLDTNVVLDLLVFSDPSARPLQAGLELSQLDWLATAAMREELQRVLGYGQIAARLALRTLDAAEVLARFDTQARIVEAAAKAPVTCSDPDDQKFIDLAVSHRCLLLSKDATVLKLKKKLAALEVSVVTAIASSS
jgi:putative PIN family toxin of toxin-antitoxin system